jgi:hypothetical protein
MVLTKEELIASLQNEVRILLHLASKLDRSQLDYRPTPKQRSAIELLRYLTIMGPNVISAIKNGAFDGAAFGAAQTAANAMNFDQAIAAIEKQSSGYAQQLGAFSDADFRGEIARRDRDVRPEIQPRRADRKHCSLRIRGLPDAAILLLESLWP